jgi:hypothetical protein
MKAGLVLVTALVLAVLRLGNASHAMAQSVTGGGTFNPSSDLQVTIAVSARSASSGPAGTVRINVPGLDTFILAEVVDLCVPTPPGNEALVVALITHSSIPFCTVGTVLHVAVQDNGRGGDKAGFGCPEHEFTCEGLLIPPQVPLTNGNIRITP